MKEELRLDIGERYVCRNRLEGHCSRPVNRVADSSIVYHRSDVLRALYHLPTADDDYNSQTGAYDVLGRNHHMLGGDYDSEY